MHHMMTNNFIRQPTCNMFSCLADHASLNYLKFWTTGFKTFDINTCINVIYLDMAKAFDSVPHKRLLSLLNSYGITDNLHKWIESFLSYRQ